MNNIRLSKSVLDDFLRCPRCFWLAKNHNLKTPQGIKSGLPMAMDSKIKAYHDRHRLAGTTPPELIGKIPGDLFPDQARLNRWRNWRSALEVQVDRFTLSGMFDDIIFDPATGLYAGYDYKTKSKAPEEGYSAKYYATQSSAYDLLLNGSGMRTGGKFYFSYWYPKEIQDNGRQMWGVDVDVLPTDHNAIKALVVAAGTCLEGPLPKPNLDCEQCDYLAVRSALMKELVADPRATAAAPSAVETV